VTYQSRVRVVRGVGPSPILSRRHHFLPQAPELVQGIITAKVCMAGQDDATAPVSENITWFHVAADESSETEIQLKIFDTFYFLLDTRHTEIRDLTTWDKIRNLVGPWPIFDTFNF
jgi:hypothetical protein